MIHWNKCYVNNALHSTEDLPFALINQARNTHKQYRKYCVNPPYFPSNDYPYQSTAWYALCLKFYSLN